MPLDNFNRANEDQVAERSPFVRIRGYLNHLESIALIRSADLLFLPLQNLPAGQRAGNVPGKTYEYLAADRPILAALPDGDARDLVTAAGAAYVVDPDDLVLGGLVDLDAGQLEQVVDRAADPQGFGEDALREATDDIGVVLTEHRLGQQAQRADRRLELVADVGDEVATNGLEPASFGDVLDARVVSATDGILDSARDDCPF